MAPIANLVVRLSAQISEFQKSFSDATTRIEKFGDDFAKTAATIEGKTQGISGSFAGIVESAAGVAAGMLTAQAAIAAVGAAFGVAQKLIDATFGSLKDAVTHTADLGDELFGLSQKTGLSVESLSAFKFVAAQTNTSLDSITGAVFKLESNLGSGAKKTSEALAGIGLSLKQLRSEDPAQAFTEIIAKLGELPNASARAATGVAIFGKSFKDIAQLSQEDLPGLIDQAKELGLVMSTETAVAADRLKDAFGILHGAGQGLQQQLGAKLLPAVVAFTEVFGGIFLDAVKKAVGSTKSLGEAFDTFVVQMGEAVARSIEVLARLVEATAQWAIETSKRLAEQTRAFLDIAPAIITVGRALDLALSGGSHASAFDSLAATLEKLKKPLDAAAESAVTVGNKIREAAKGIAEAANGAGATFGFTFSGIQQQISDAADEMRKKLKAVGDGGAAGATGAGDAFKSFGKNLAELTAQIDRANANGTPLADMLKLFGDEASKSATKGAAWGIAVSQSVQNVADSFDLLKNNKAFDELSASWEKVQAAFTEGTAKVTAGMQQAALKEANASGASLIKTIAEREKAQDRVNEIGLSGLRLTLKNIDEAQAAERKGWQQRIPQNAAAYDQMKAASDKFYDHERKLAIGTSDTIVERMSRQGVQTKAALQGVADAAKRDYDQMLKSGQFTAQGLAEAMEKSASAQRAATGKVVSAWQTAFKNIGSELPRAIAQGFTQNGIGGAFAGAATVAAKEFGDVFAKGMQRTGDVFKDLKFSEKAAGLGAVAAQSFVSGFQSGLENPGTLSALSAVASGALSGLPFGVVGVGVGATIALVGFMAGAFKNAKAEADALRNEMAKLVTQFHGLSGLKEAAERSGFALKDLRGNALSTSESIDKIFRAPDAASFNREIGLLNASLDAYNERLKAISSATDGVNARTATFAKQFAPLVTAKKTATDSGDTAGASAAGQQIQELAQRTQPEFERLGLFVRDTFAAIVKETGSAISAITQLAPSFQLLKSGITDFGLTSTGVIDSLMGSFDIVNNEAFKPFFENIQATGQAFKGLFDAKALSPDTFQAAAADIGQSIQEIINRGADMAKTYALSAPQLQALWEAQQTFGAITDQTTQSILAQAEAQGVVGEQFKSVNEKILDVLLAIGDALNAVIPAGLRGLSAPAAEAGAAIRGSLGTAFDDVAAKVDPTVGESLRGIRKPAEEAGQSVESSLTGALDHSARVARDRAIEMGGVVGDAFKGVPRQWDSTVGASLSSLPGKAKTAADGISDALSKVKAPDINITAKVNVEQPDPVVIHYDYSSDWTPKGSGGMVTPIPLATGGIVRSPTYALIGEAGPEAVVPLSKLTAFATATTQPDRRVDAFAGMGSALSGLVSTARTVVDQVNRELARILSPSVAVDVRMGALPKLPAFTPTSVVNVPSVRVSETRERAYAARPTVEAAMADLFSGLGTSPSDVRSSDRWAGVAPPRTPVRMDSPHLATAAAVTIGQSLSGITAPDLHITVNVGDPSPIAMHAGSSRGPRVSALATGSLVRQPMPARIGDAGPEAVAPLSKMPAFTRATLGIERRSRDVFSGMASPIFGTGIPHLATGGIATRRTLAILAESGPEAVIPLHSASIPGPTGGETTVQMWMDGRLMGEVLLPRAAQAAKRFGLVPR